MTLKTFRDFEANYPERLGEAFIINGELLRMIIFNDEFMVHGFVLKKEELL